MTGRQPHDLVFGQYGICCADRRWLGSRAPRLRSSVSSHRGRCRSVPGRTPASGHRCTRPTRRSARHPSGRNASGGAALARRAVGGVADAGRPPAPRDGRNVPGHHGAEWPLRHSSSRSASCGQGEIRWHGVQDDPGTVVRASLPTLPAGERHLLVHDADRRRRVGSAVRLRPLVAQTAHPRCPWGTPPVAVSDPNSFEDGARGPLESDAERGMERGEQEPRNALMFIFINDLQDIHIGSTNCHRVLFGTPTRQSLLARHARSVDLDGSDIAPA